LLNPTQFLPEDDNVTVTTSNMSTYTVESDKASALSALMQNQLFAGAIFQLNTAAAIADSSATQIFVMEGAKVIKKRCSTRPLKVTLADGRGKECPHTCATYTLMAYHLS
jgi:hypothetical protein